MAPLSNSEERAFDKKLEHDAARWWRRWLYETDLARAVGNCDQHDVDNSDRAQGECDQSDAAQKHIHGIEDLAHLVDRLHGVPLIKRIRIAGIEAVVAGRYLVHFFLAPLRGMRAIAAGS